MVVAGGREAQGALGHAQDQGLLRVQPPLRGDGEAVAVRVGALQEALPGDDGGGQGRAVRAGLAVGGPVLERLQYLIS